MKIKDFLWLLLAIIVTWLFFYTISYTNTGVEKWWHPPLTVTSILVWWGTVGYSFLKIKNG